jgi:AcrR family transcriptional regulator
MLYTETMTPRSATRTYRKRARARQEEETRRRITEAAVELHRTLGPANTRMTDVARRAGVSRMTVYNHFPREIDLFVACSSHWATQSPFPDPSGWEAIDDPSERLVAALKALYRWYRLNEEMLGKVFRDAPNLPAVAKVMDDLWSPYVEKLLRTLTRGWASTGAQAAERRAALRLVADFAAWRLLAATGLNPDRAAGLAARMVACVS